MLEKSLKKVEFDAHFHYFLAEFDQKLVKSDEIHGCTCAHSIEEWKNQFNLANGNKNIQLSCGLHPQIFVNKDIDFDDFLLYICALAEEKKIDAIGETGFDFLTKEYKNCSELQEKYFVNQIELAIKYNLPVIIHCRKANEKLFEYSNLLKKLPSVLFHSFMGTPVEALSLQKRGVNAFFSFGKQVLNNNKKVISCVTSLPLTCLLCETDAPFQTLKGENQTYLSEIKKVYKAFIELRNEDEDSFYLQMENNYKRMFSLR